VHALQAQQLQLCHMQFCFASTKQLQQAHPLSVGLLQRAVWFGLTDIVCFYMSTASRACTFNIPLKALYLHDLSLTAGPRV
jgi:hypothetical protein